MFAYLNGIYKAYSNETGIVSMIEHTENHLVTLACFFAACNEDYSRYRFGHAQLKTQQGVFIVTLYTSIWADLDAIDQYEMTCKAGLKSLLSILASRSSPEVN